MGILHCATFVDLFVKYKLRKFYDRRTQFFMRISAYPTVQTCFIQLFFQFFFALVFSASLLNCSLTVFDDDDDFNQNFNETKDNGTSIFNIGKRISGNIHIILDTIFCV